MLPLKIKKPAAYFLSILAIFVLIEVLVTSTPFIFSNLTERVKLKSAMFDFKDDTELLFLGSSRFKDGISPSIFIENIENSLHTDWKGFNGAITGANITRLKYFFDIAVQKKTKLVVLEISLPQLTSQELTLDKSLDSLDFEEKLQHFISNTFNVIQWRKSFRLENLINAPAILAANHMDGTELYKAGGLKDFLNNSKYTLTNEEKKLWTPSFITPIIDSIPSKNKFVKIFEEMAISAKENNVEILLIIPPLVNSSQKKETRTDVLNLYQKIANKTGKSIINYSELKISENLFRDKDSHLNKEGRYTFSRILSSQILPTMQNITKD